MSTKESVNEGAFREGNGMDSGKLPIPEEFPFQIFMLSSMEAEDLLRGLFIDFGHINDSVDTTSISGLAHRFYKVGECFRAYEDIISACDGNSQNISEVTAVFSGTGVLFIESNAHLVMFEILMRVADYLFNHSDLGDIDPRSNWGSGWEENQKYALSWVDGHMDRMRNRMSAIELSQIDVLRISARIRRERSIVLSHYSDYWNEFCEYGESESLERTDYNNLTRKKVAQIFEYTAGRISQLTGEDELNLKNDESYFAEGKFTIRGLLKIANHIVTKKAYQSNSAAKARAVISNLEKLGINVNG
tara:strand:+ start:167834 stop:168745 length:912 start_codon:yes stop_codon:yes gene_type:complete